VGRECPAASERGGTETREAIADDLKFHPTNLKSERRDRIRSSGASTYPTFGADYTGD
jgi:hypothetical protein